jgi:hypothetical protein
MKSFKKFVAEVAQPKPEEEKRFKDMHTYETKPHPVAEPHQHTGEISKPKAKRLADQEGDANYDKPLKNAEKRMVPESVEEAEQIDEISKELAARYLKKAPARAADAGDKVARASTAYDKETGDKQKKKGIRTFLNTHKGVERATNRLMKDEELSAKQKKIDHNKNGKIDGHDLAMLRKKKNEEVEQLDELSPETLDNYTAKAAMGDKSDSALRKKARAHKTLGNDAEAKRLKDKAKKRSTGFDKATARQLAQTTGYTGEKGSRLDKAANKMPQSYRKVPRKEEVELDETTSSALKRPVTQTGPDGKTRTVMKKARNDKTDDRGQDKFESVEMIDEAVKLKRGPMRLKDGSQVMVSKEDADLLNRMFKDLSANNQRQMEKVMMMDKAGFEEIRGFAREAL